MAQSIALPILGPPTYFNIATGANAGSHTHTSSSASHNHSVFGTAEHTHTLSSADSRPPYYEILFIQAASSNSSLATGLIVMWSGLISTIPTGWALCDGTSPRPDLRSRFIRGAPAGQEPGTTGGSDTHAHTTDSQGGHTHYCSESGSASHTLPSGSYPHIHGSVGPYGANPVAAQRDTSADFTHQHGATDSIGFHTHSLDTQGAHTHSPASASSRPAFRDILFIYNASSAELPIGSILIWAQLLQDMPIGYRLCDGTGSPDLRSRFVRGADAGVEPGGTGGSDTHTHTDSSAGGHSHNQTNAGAHTHASTDTVGAHIHGSFGTGTSGGSAPVDANAGNHSHSYPSGGGHTHPLDSMGNHQHTINYQDTRPAYYEVAFILYAYGERVIEYPFSGPDGSLPPRGKWFTILSRSVPLVTFEKKIMEIYQNMLHMVCLPHNGSGATNIFSRFKMKLPFTIKAGVMAHTGGFGIMLESTDPREGTISGTRLYGKQFVSLDTIGSQFRLKIIKDGSLVEYLSSYGIFDFDLWYDVQMTVTELQAYFHLELTIYDVAAQSYVWTIGKDFDKCQEGYLRARLSGFAPTDTTTENWCSNFTMSTKTSKKSAAHAEFCNSITPPNNPIFIPEVVRFSVSMREGAASTATMTISNLKGKYNGIVSCSEFCLWAGFEDALYLLFRGIVETKSRSYPPALLNVEGAKDYSKRLDHRTALSKSYDTYRTDEIIADLLNAYLPGIFTFDHIVNGTTINASFDDKQVLEVIRQLADLENFIFYVDENVDLHFNEGVRCESGTSGITISEGVNIMDIEYRTLDEVLNGIRVEGYSTTSTESDSESADRYWLRERTFKDDNLTNQAATNAMAIKLLEKYKDEIVEVNLTIPGMFQLGLYDYLTLKSDSVGIDGSLQIKGIQYIGDTNGMRTRLYLSHRGLFLAEILSQHEKLLAGQY